MTAREQWTPADEQRWAEMNDRRARLLTARRENLESTLDEALRAGFGGMSTPQLVDALIARADSIRDALLPFDSGVRNG